MILLSLSGTGQLAGSLSLSQPAMSGVSLGPVIRTRKYPGPTLRYYVLPPPYLPPRQEAAGPPAG